MVNFNKSKLIGVNISEEFLETASIFLHCRTKSIPFKFLGIPVGANPSRASTWKPVLHMLRKRLSTWKGRTLSIGGRVIFINSVIFTISLIIPLNLVIFFSINNFPLQVSYASNYGKYGPGMLHQKCGRFLARLIIVNLIYTYSI